VSLVEKSISSYLSSGLLGLRRTSFFRFFGRALEYGCRWMGGISGKTLSPRGHRGCAIAQSVPKSVFPVQLFAAVRVVIFAFAPGVQGRRQVCSRVDAAPEAYCCARVLWHHLTLQGARLTQLQIRRRGKADAACYRRADEFARPQNAPWIRPSSLNQCFSAD